jgi:cobalt-zinc-cadmium efflux system membrane fusion protein
MDAPPNAPNAFVGGPHDPPSPSPRTSLATLVACAALSLGVGVALGRGTAPTASPPPAAAAPSTDRPRVRLDPELARRAQIRTERVARSRVAATLQLAGSVDFDATRTAEVGGRIPGRITRILVRPGDMVRAGDALAEIESAQLGEGIAQYFSAQARLIAARQALARETSLSAQRLTTAQALEEARANAQALQAESRGAEARLVAMGLAPSELPSTAGASAARRVTLRAPIAGEVIARQGVVGQSVEPTSTLLRIGDTSELWVHLDVFERDLARVHDGDRAEIVCETWPGRVFHGVVEHVDPVVDPSTRTARVRVEVANEGAILRPGQFVTARLHPTGGDGRDALTVPRASLLQIEGRPAVFVVVGRDQYEPRALELGVSDGERVEVVRGLAEGDEAVVEGAFALKSELQR